MVENIDKVAWHETVNVQNHEDEGEENGKKVENELGNDGKKLKDEQNGKAEQVAKGQKGDGKRELALFFPVADDVFADER